MGGILEVASGGGILRLIVRSREIHLSRQPPSECPQRHIGSRGEFHGSGLPLSEVPLGPIG